MVLYKKNISQEASVLAFYAITRQKPPLVSSRMSVRPHLFRIFIKIYIPDVC